MISLKTISMSKLDDVFKDKLNLLIEQQKAIEKYLSATEKKILQEYVNFFLGKLHEDKDGNIKSDKTTAELSTAIDKIIDGFVAKNLNLIAKRIQTDFSELVIENKKYYNEMVGKLARDVSSSVIDQLNQHLGSGFINNLVSAEPLRQELKAITFAAVQEGTPMAEFKKQIQIKIAGSKAEDVNGTLTKHVGAFVYDSYLQYDRTINLEYAKELTLTQFIYSGGLIEDSRVFCKNKNNRVFSIEEAELWKDDPDLLRTVDERKTGILQGYIPTIHMGRWRCRHIARFVTPELADKYERASASKEEKNKIAKESPAIPGLKELDNEIERITKVVGTK